MNQQVSKLNELAETSARKNGGTTAHYVTANQALRDDIYTFLTSQFNTVVNQITTRKSDLMSVKSELAECKVMLAESNKREKCLLDKITTIEKSGVLCSSEKNKDDFYIVGSSLLREVRDSDIKNGAVKCIRGGKIDDIKKDIQNMKHQPRNIITHVGGNDLDDDNATVPNVTSQYEVFLTEIKNKFPDSNVIISGLPPRFPNDINMHQSKGF